MNKLTRGQKSVLWLAAVPIVAVGAAGAFGTYTNVMSVLHRTETALGVVAAGEGATLVVALVMVAVTLLGQPSPWPLRVSLWALPAAGSGLSYYLAPSVRDAVVYSMTHIGMTVSAEGLGFLCRRVVVYRTGVDTEAQQRNADLMRRIAYHQARSLSHPRKWAQKASRLKAWSLMSRSGERDLELGSRLISVQREWLMRGAETALSDMLEPGASSAVPELEQVTEPVAQAPDLRIDPVSRGAEPRAHVVEQVTEPDPVVILVERLRSGERLTKGSAAEILGVSTATAGRRLREARERLENGGEAERTGFYP